jgi:hypothetical protein
MPQKHITAPQGESQHCQSREGPHYCADEQANIRRGRIHWARSDLETKPRQELKVSTVIRRDGENQQKILCEKERRERSLVEFTG